MARCLDAMASSDSSALSPTGLLFILLHGSQIPSRHLLVDKPSRHIHILSYHYGEPLPSGHVSSKSAARTAFLICERKLVKKWHWFGSRERTYLSPIHSTLCQILELSDLVHA